MEASDHPLVREKLHYKALNGDHWHALCHLPRPLQGADAILGPLQSRCEAHRLGCHRRLSLLQANKCRMVHFTKNSALFHVGTLQTFFLLAKVLTTTTTKNWNPYMYIISSLCCLWICIYYLPYVFLYVHSFYVYMTYEMLNIPMPHVLQCPMYVFL